MRHWAALLGLVWEELRRGGWRDLKRNLASRVADEEVELRRRMVGAPRVEFDGKLRVTPPPRGWGFHEIPERKVKP